MRLKYLAIVFAAIILFAATASAQGPAALKASAARQWVSFSNKGGFNLDLPDFFKKGAPTSSGSDQYQPADANNNGVIVIVSRIGDGNAKVLADRYNQLTHDLKHQEDTKIDLQKLSKSYYLVTSHDYDDDKLDKNGKEQKFFWYERGIVTVSGVYEVSIRYQPEFRKAVAAIIPRIVNSFQAQSKQAFIQH